ncbi:MAG TPA: carbamoyltransferase C-terminal domain-containing protein [Chthoniobacterales bacterium]|jgi:carbamoyltransferase|nr:carbamoyltransferase C-terminal domain-containing protein [Chthoniobacterales bacterium]
MKILGLNAYHGDSAACLLVDGKLVAAAEEERFRRIKHWAGLPTNAINYVLEEGKLSLGEIDHIAINRKPGVNNLRRLGFVLTHWPHPKLMAQKIKNIRSAASIKEALEATYGSDLRAQFGTGIKAEVHHVEHHLAHLASTFLVSGFNEAACISIDGFGDFASTAFGFGQGGEVKIDNRVYFPHSLGIFYSALTQYLGFPHYGDEYKVMGLAPYGEPNYLEQLREVVRIRPDGSFRLNLRFFRHHIGNVSYTWRDCAPEVGTLYRRALVDLLGPPRRPDEPLEQKHKDIARSVQATYEKAFFALLQALHKQHPSDHLAIAGGCAMNSVANGKVYRRSPFKKMYCPAAAGDAGGAIGAAAFVQSELDKGAEAGSSELEDRDSQLLPSIYDLRSKRSLISAYLGPESSEEEIHALIDWKKKEISDGGCTIALVADEAELVSKTAKAIADGKIVGWFQGRMEWGPRALGNRSILADPRNAGIKDVLNAKIKRRESFRPFAPSILRESVAEWFETDDDVPFMMKVFQIRSKYRDMIPAVIHVDGTGRLQTVHKETNPRYHRLIEHFRDLTGIPVVLNTSFNENEPVVCYPEEALDCFLRTQMDVLVLGNFFIERKS